MPSPGEDIQSWSTTAADNGASDPLINWQEGQARASVNNSSRSQMAAHAKNRNLLNGSIVTTGAANAQAFLSGLTYTSIPTGLRATLKIGVGLTNTGSTTLNMDGIGDVLVKTANGSDLLGGEFVANGYVDLLYDGTNWLFLYGREFMFDRITSGGGIISSQQIFTTSSTFLPSPDMECCIVECVGGGGGGGGGTGGVNVVGNGAGGGSGGYSRKFLTAAEVGGSQAIAVGAGGTVVTGGPGGAGGASSFGTLCIANGGFGGGTIAQAGGAGAAPGTGDLAAAGSPGEAGYVNMTGAVDLNFSFSGAGGSGPWGGGAPAAQSGANSHTAGNVASNYGGGGGGCSTYNFGASISGSPGSAGVVVVTEFSGKGAPGRDGAAGPIGPIGPAGPAGAGTGDVLASGTPTAG